MRQRVNLMGDGEGPGGEGCLSLDNQYCPLTLFNSPAETQRKDEYPKHKRHNDGPLNKTQPIFKDILHGRLLG